MPQSNSYTFDKNLQLKDAGAIAASAAAQVASADKVLDLGAGRFNGVAIVDITAIEVADGNESYHVELQFSNSASFASTNIVGPCMKFGDSTVNFGSADTAPGRVEIPFCNEYFGTKYRYMRAFTRVGGTVATGINYTAWVASQP